jgi:hypothetical protein
MTMVLCPKEKNRPQVTGNCPKLIKVLVALSIALERDRISIIRVCSLSIRYS